VSDDQATPAPEPISPSRKSARWRASTDQGHRGARLYPAARSGFIEFDRVLFFSDAVFAIAAALLSRTARAATAAKITTAHEITAHGQPDRLRISFAVIALFWLGHHGIFRYITAFDRPLILLNLLFLGTIAFLPYPTALLSAQSLGHGDAVIFYAICAGAAGLVETAIWLYATRRGSGLTDSSVDGVRLQYVPDHPVPIAAISISRLVRPRCRALYLDPDLPFRARDQQVPPAARGAGTDWRGDPQLSAVRRMIMAGPGICVSAASSLESHQFPDTPPGACGTTRRRR
jgi:hypothetical protein